MCYVVCDVFVKMSVYDKQNRYRHQCEREIWFSFYLPCKSSFGLCVCVCDCVHALSFRFLSINLFTIVVLFLNLRLLLFCLDKKKIKNGSASSPCI